MWQPINTAPPQQEVLIHYTNRCGKSRIVKARFTPRFTVASSGGSDDEYDEYDEVNDRYTYCEGWYEQIDNWSDYSAVHVCEGEPDYWHPLPEPPAVTANGAPDSDPRAQALGEWAEDQHLAETLADSMDLARWTTVPRCVAEVEPHNARYTLAP